MTFFFTFFSLAILSIQKREEKKTKKRNGPAAGLRLVLDRRGGPARAVDAPAGQRREAHRRQVLHA